MDLGTKTVRARCPDRQADFRSDNLALPCPEVLAAVMEASTSFHGPEANAMMADRLRSEMERVFAGPAEAAAVFTGTAANAISLALGPAGNRCIVCHADAHIRRHEADAFGLYRPESRLVPLAGADGKLDADAVADAFSRLPDGGGHMLSIANTTELGTVYDAAELRSLAGIVRHYRSFLHVDGARFAQAVAALEASPHDLSIGAGVDVLSLGMSKNGAIAADAVVVFNRDLAASLAGLRKRGGHDAARDFLASAQILRLLQDDLWLRHARRSNAALSRLVSGLEAVPGIRFVAPRQSNQLFVSLPATLAGRLKENGFGIRLWFEPDIYRIVTAYDTSDEAVDGLVDAIRTMAGP